MIEKALRFHTWAHDKLSCVLETQNVFSTKLLAGKIMKFFYASHSLARGSLKRQTYHLNSF